MCSCSSRKKQSTQPLAPLPQFSIQTADSGAKVQIAARSDCLLLINDRKIKMTGGASASAFRPEALQLIENGAPIWIVA